jgi:hypothetical protein
MTTANTQPVGSCALLAYCRGCHRPGDFRAYYPTNGFCAHCAPVFVAISGDTWRDDPPPPPDHRLPPRRNLSPYDPTRHSAPLGDVDDPVLSLATGHRAPDRYGHNDQLPNAGDDRDTALVNAWHASERAYEWRGPRSEAVRRAHSDPALRPREIGPLVVSVTRGDIDRGNVCASAKHPAALALQRALVGCSAYTDRDRGSITLCLDNGPPQELVATLALSRWLFPRDKCDMKPVRLVISASRLYGLVMDIHEDDINGG